MFLDDILKHKYAEVAAGKTNRPLDAAAMNPQSPGNSRSFIQELTRNGMGLIAEVKKASPSKGLLCPDFDPARLAIAYEQAGAGAISVLTDERFFQGSLDYLPLVKGVTRRTPVLRKDFIIDSYQLLEARLYQADAVLLIVAALEDKKLTELLTEAEQLGLTPLVEVHDATELSRALDAGAKVVGVNNRNLQTFEVNLETTFQLLTRIPAGITIVSESGIRNGDDLKRLKAAGVHAVLIGEALVTAADPAAKIRELLEAVS
jgi:indole-3-glycerol phosphate synthase